MSQTETTKVVAAKPQSTERARVKGLLKKQKGAPLNLG